MKKVLIYSKHNCPYCDRAKELLISKKQAYTEVVIGEDIIREDFVSIFPEVKTVPLIIIDDVKLGGFTDLVEYYKN